MKINIYTDGSSFGNPGKGGYGIIMEVSDGSYRKSFMQGYRKTTNNRMELLAVIVALENIKINNAKVTIYSDSKYVIDVITKKWLFTWQKKQFKSKKNVDLWMRFLKIYPKHQITFKWIKGHNNNPKNELCDKLAKESTNQKELLVDEEYEKLVNKNDHKLC